MKNSMNARELVGKEIIGTRGWRIGRVKNVVLDMETWEVTALEVSLAKNVTKEFGLKQVLRSMRLPIKVQEVQGVGDAAITLKISKAQLGAILRPGAAAKEPEKPPGDAHRSESKPSK